MVGREDKLIQSAGQGRVAYLQQIVHGLELLPCEVKNEPAEPVAVFLPNDPIPGGSPVIVQVKYQREAVVS